MNLRLPTVFVFALCALFRPSVGASDFGARFDHFKTNASKPDLYRFLYAMPKAGDLHHHAGGSWRMEDLFSVAIDAKRNGGNRFYTRVKAGGCPDETNS